MVGAHELDERLYLSFLARDLDQHILRADVDDTTTKHLDQEHDLHALLGRSTNFDQHEVALNEVFAADVLDRHHSHDLVELLPNLFQLRVVAVDHKGHPREIGIFGLSDRQTIDVETARCQHSRNVRQHAGLILYQCRENVPHA